MVQRKAIHILQALICILAATADGSYETERYFSLGCWKFTNLTRQLEGTTTILDGNYKNRSDAVPKCSAISSKKHLQVFAVWDGGKCQGLDDDVDDLAMYTKLGPSTKCAMDGKGGPDASQVYTTISWFHSKPYGFIKSCVKRGSLPTLEGNAKQLDGDSKTRTDPEGKCYEAAKERGWSLFTISWNGACNSGPDAVYTYMAQGTASCYQGEGDKVYAIPALSVVGPAPSTLTSTSHAPSSSFVPSPTPAQSLSTVPSVSPAPGVTISCGERIDIQIEGNNVNAGASSLHLSTVTGASCSAVKRGGSFSFSIGLNDCGTTVTSTEEYIVYENTIRVDNNLTKGMIQRQHDKAISFRCRYNRKNKLNNVEFSGSNTQIQYNTTKYGTFELSIGLFKENKYTQVVQPNDAIDVLGTIYARLRLTTSGGSIKMAVQSCIATPRNTPPDNTTYTHELINNRCLADSTVGVIDEGNAREFKFKFQSFVFAKLGDSVFIHCTVVVCEAGESTQTCTNPSAPCSEIGRRSISMGGAKYRKYAITHGPFKQTKWKRSLHLTTKTRSTTGKDWRVVSAVVSGGLFVILVASVVIWRNKHSQLHEYTGLKEVHSIE